MALFQKTPEKTLQRDRDAAKANVDRLAISLTAAEDAVIATKSAAQRAALSGDDAGLDTAEHAEAGALRRLATITTAFAEAEHILAKLDGQIAAKLDETTRAATARETNAIGDELIQAAAGFDIAIGILADISTRAAAIVFESSGLASFSASSRIEVPAAVDVVAGLLREHANRVLNGMAPAVLPTPEKPFAPTIPARPVTVSVFATRAIKWTDGEGQLRYCQRYNDAELPAATAARALKLKACLPIDDPARRQHKGTWPGHPDPAQCFNLDKPGAMATEFAAAANEPVQFQRVDRGGTYELRVAAGGAS